jgi:RNA polymerase sigma-70 factor, ECF subfamily
VYQVNEGMLGQQNFADCIAQHMPYLKRAVDNLTRGDQAAEDIIQQTVLKALMHADQFRFESTLNTWLIAIAVNEIRQVYRSSWRVRAVPLITENLNPDHCALIESPHDRCEKKERDNFVRRAISRLPREYRGVIELCYLQDLSQEEAARQLGLTVAALKTRRHRARKKLRHLLTKLHRS